MSFLLTLQTRLIQVGRITLGVTAVLGVLCWLLQNVAAIQLARSLFLSVLPLLLSIGLGCLLVAGMIELKQRKRLFQGIAIVLIGINSLSYVGVYALTHSVSPGEWGLGQAKIPSSKHPDAMGLPYTTQRIPYGKEDWLEAWLIPSTASRGSILLFPGSGGTKGEQLLAPAKVFHELGFNCLLVDFRGLGGSSGNTKTIGALEAKDVVITVNYAQAHLRSPIVLYGISMGSAAILRAIALNQVEANSLILELPYDRLLNAIYKRFAYFHLPAFPIAELMLFWGSVQHGFNGFAHNPVTFARQVNFPTLILQGDQDQWIDLRETKELYQNLKGEKKLVVFTNAGHHLLVTVNEQLWRKSIEDFLATT